MLTELISKENILECPKNSIKDLVDTLIGRYGSAVSVAILDNTGNIDRSIQVAINDRDCRNDNYIPCPLGVGM